MSKLLRANFMRLKKSSSFALSVILQVFIAAIFFLMEYFISHEKNLIFGKSFIVGSYIMIFLSVFITSFICTDYSCQTIRNKLIVGHSREEIYFSNFITVWIGSLMMMAAHWITVLTLSVFFGTKASVPPDDLCFIFITQIAAVTALVSLYVLLSELVTKKSIAVTAALIFSFIFPAMKEPMFFTDIMPSGQLVQIEQMEAVTDIQLMFPVYSLAVTVASTAIGILIFRRKDLK